MFLFSRKTNFSLSPSRIDGSGHNRSKIEHFRSLRISKILRLGKSYQRVLFHRLFVFCKGKLRSRGAFCCACAKKICSARSAPFWYFQRAFAGFQLSDRHLSVIFFGEGWKSMTSLPPFLTLWILVEFAGSSDEDILMIKVRTKREKRPKTWSLRFDLLTIKMCIRDYKPWRLVLRCWCLTSMNHEVVCGGDREIFVTIIEGSLQFDLILLQLWNKITLSSRWPPSFKSLQITSSLLSLCSPIGYKA